MKILFFMESYRSGGVDTFVINLINNWPYSEDELTLICNSDHDGLEGIKSKIRRTCEISGHNVRTFMGFFDKSCDLIFLSKIIKLLLRAFSPIIRYIFLAYNIIALKKTLLYKDADRLLIINGGYPGGDSCRAAGIIWGIFSKNPLSIHNFHGIALRAGVHIKLQEYAVDYFVARFSRMFLTVSCAAAKTMSCRKAIYRAKRVSYIYSGTEIHQDGRKDEKRSLRLELGIPESSFICMMLGGYAHSNYFDKGHIFLFRAFKKVIQEVPGVHLLVCGHGTKEQIASTLQDALRFNLGQNLHLYGFRDDVPYLLKHADILLVSSQTFESFGLVSIEAMSRKVPVVATNVGGIPEILINGQGGYCVDKNDVDSYAASIINLLKNEGLRKEQGEKGFKRWADFFTAQRMAGEYAKLIRDE